MKYKIVLPFIIICILCTGCQITSAYKQHKSIESAEGSDSFINTNCVRFDFTRANGSNLQYYVCQTVYIGNFKSVEKELNINAIRTVFDINNSFLIQYFEISGHPAAIYENGPSHYICCTISPESSVVLQYSPAEMEDETAICVIQSIFESQAFQA